MNVESKIIFLESLLGSYERRGREYLFSCISKDCVEYRMEGHRLQKKMSVNFEDGVFKCWYCGYKGKIDSLINKHFPKISSEWDFYDKESVDTQDIIDKILKTNKESKNNKLNFPVDYELIINNLNNPNFQEAISYLKNRGILFVDILKYQMGIEVEGDYRGKIIIPSFDLNGNLNYFISRDYTGRSRQRYKNADFPKQEIIFNEFFIDFKKPVYLVEGLFDVIKMGEQTIPILGSYINKEWYLFKKISENKTQVNIILDPEAFEEALKMYKLFSESGIDTKICETKDIEDLGSLSYDEAQSYKEKCFKPSFLDLIKHKI